MLLGDGTTTGWGSRSRWSPFGTWAMFLADPVDVPAELVQYLAEQLGIDDPSCVKQYTERRMTRFEHQTEIQQEYGISPFAEVKAAFRASWKGVVKALRRLEDVQAVGIGAVDLSMVPPRRLTGLATYGLAGKASALRRLEPRSQRVAVLAATAKAMLARAVDDVLEVFDLLMTTHLLGRAERQSRDEKLARYP